MIKYLIATLLTLNKVHLDERPKIPSFAFKKLFLPVEELQI